jgi:hypothetical protein
MAKGPVVASAAIGTKKCAAALVRAPRHAPSPSVEARTDRDSTGTREAKSPATAQTSCSESRWLSRAATPSPAAMAIRVTEISAPHPKRDVPKKLPTTRAPRSSSAVSP